MVALGRSRAILPGGPQRHHLPTTLDQRCQLLFLRSRQRAGYADLALQVQDLWLKRQRQEAVALIPDKLVLKTHLLGTPAMVRERLRVHHQAGVTTLRVVTEGETLDECLMTLSQLLELVKEVNAEPEHQRIS